MSRCHCDPCNVEPISSNNVKWAAPNLPCTGVLTCDSLTVALQKVDEQICDLKDTIVTLQEEINTLKNNCCTTTTTTTLL